MANLQDLTIETIFKMSDSEIVKLLHQTDMIDFSKIKNNREGNFLIGLCGFVYSEAKKRGILTNG